MERGIAELPTAWRAAYGAAGPKIAFLSGYDALPEIGHACGHNPIGTGGVATARPGLPGAEGPLPGRPDPRCGQPLEGGQCARRDDPVLRKRQYPAPADPARRPAARRHHPRRLGSQCDSRADRGRLPGAGEGRRLPGGARQNNMVMARAFQANLESLGEVVTEPDPTASVGSSDIGNVSLVTPSIHPYVRIAKQESAGHTAAFREAAGSALGYSQMIKAAKAMAMTAIDLIANPETLAAAKAEFVAASR